VAGSSPAAGSSESLKYFYQNFMIPKHAKRVFKGQVFEIFQWQQKMFNDTKRTFEVAKRIDGASIIATVKDKIVVLKQRHPHTSWYWTVPGGYLDHPGETPKQGALRELLEETGLKPKTMRLWKVYPRGGRIESRLHIFIARDCAKIDDPKLDGGEKIRLEYRTFDEFLKMSDLPDFHNRDLIIEMQRARLSNQAKLRLKKQIFG
jgi:ADP-ribose pyrophosphatase